MANHYVYETRRTCPCQREVDAIRIVGETGGRLRLSRHLARNKRGFCSQSLAEVPRGTKGDRR